MCVSHHVIQTPPLESLAQSTPCFTPVPVFFQQQTQRLADVLWLDGSIMVLSWFDYAEEFIRILSRVVRPQQDGVAVWYVEAGLLASSRCDLGRHGAAGPLGPTSASGPGHRSAPLAGLCGSALLVWEVEYTLFLCSFLKRPAWWDFIWFYRILKDPFHAKVTLFMFSKHKSLNAFLYLFVMLWGLLSLYSC